MLIRTFKNTSEEGRKFASSTRCGNVYHPKDYTVMMICTKGSATFVYEGLEREFKENTGVFINKDIRFDLRNKSEDYTSTICVLTDECMKDVFYGDVLYSFNCLAYRPRFFHVSARMARLCRFILERAALATKSDISYKDEIATCYIKIIIYTALDINMKQTGQGVFERRETIITDRFLNLVKNNFREYRKIKDYANMMGFSPKYLSGAVLKASGRHANEWIDDHCLYEIKERLKSGYYSVQQISYDLNFSTPSHLSKFFKEKTGLTPLEYKEMKKSTPPQKNHKYL